MPPTKRWPRLIEPLHWARALHVGLLAPWLMLATAAAVVASTPGLIAHFDWPLHLYWVQEFARNVAEGSLHPHWIAGANGGYGAPSFVFYGPLAYWMACAPTALTGSALAGLKSVYVVAVLLSGYSCRILYGASGRASAIAIAATLSPPLLMLVTRYNMPAAAIAAALSPLAIAGVRSASRWSACDVSSIAVPVALVALAHLPSAFMLLVASFLLAATGVGAPDGGRKAGIVAAGLVTGLGLSAFYVLPAVWELRWVQSDALVNGVLDWHRNLLLDPATPFALRARGDGPYLEAIAIGLVAIAALAWFCSERFGGRHEKIDTRSWALSGIVLVALCTPLASGFYALVPGAAYLQFGWRWLPLASIFAWSSVATLPREHSAPHSFVKSLCLPAIALLASCPLMFGTSGFIAPTQRTTDAQIEWALGANRLDPPEHLPLTAPSIPPTASSAPTWKTLYGDAVATPILARDEARVWKTNASTDSVGRVRTLCHPAWRARIDGRTVPIACDRDGVMILQVPHGAHEVETEFAMTGDRAAGWLLSLLIAAGLFIWSWRARGSHPRQS